MDARVQVRSGSAGAEDGTPLPVDRRGRRYNSETMQLRRAQIVKQAQRLLADVGIAGFTINELSRRANVAQRTLYNSLGNKEQIIGIAITEHYDSMVALLPPFQGRTLADYVDRASLLSGFTIQLARYATAIVSVVFSSNLDPFIRDQLWSLTLRGYDGLIEPVTRAGLMRPLADIERTMLLAQLPGLNYGLVVDWVAGRLTDYEYRTQAPVTLLNALYPYFEPAARAEADRMKATFAKRGCIKPPIATPRVDLMADD